MEETPSAPSSFPGEALDIPLPPIRGASCEPTAPAGAAVANFAPSYPSAQPQLQTMAQSALYDAQTVAYYQAYYNQAYGGYPYFSAGVGNPVQATLQPGVYQQQQQQLVAAHVAANGMATHLEAQQAGDAEEGDEEGEEEQTGEDMMTCWGNEKTMNLNPLVLTNIQQSPYFKVTLYQLKTYKSVVKEIVKHVKHLEPWEMGSRRMSGQTGMCGSVRGVGAGGIVSTPFCILYKLYTLRLSRRQVLEMLDHKESAFIRAIGLMYIRFTQAPENLWEWYEWYLEDEQECRVKAGQGGQTMTIGQIARHMLTKLDWFSTLFPRIPVPIQKDIEKKLNQYENERQLEMESNIRDTAVEDEAYAEGYPEEEGEVEEEEDKGMRNRGREKEAEKATSSWRPSNEKRSRSRERPKRSRSRSRSRDRERERYRDRERPRGSRSNRRESRSRSRSREKPKRNEREKDHHKKKNYYR